MFKYHWIDLSTGLLMSIVYWLIYGWFMLIYVKICYLLEWCLLELMLKWCVLILHTLNRCVIYYYCFFPERKHVSHRSPEIYKNAGMFQDSPERLWLGFCQVIINQRGRLNDAINRWASICQLLFLKLILSQSALV